MRATLLDLWRSWFDRSVLPGGYLCRQDDLIETVSEEQLPYDRLVERAAEHGIRVHDFRQRERTPAQKRGVAKGTRELQKVTALWWHQMAAVINDPERCLSIPAHSAVTRPGDIVLLHPLRAYLWHGHAANSFSIGIEMSIRAAGIAGDPRTFWRSRDDKRKGLEYEDLAAEISARQVIAGRLLAEYYVTEVDRQRALAMLTGSGIVASGDHRMSHSSRVSDPGSKAHQQLTRWVADHHGLEVGPVVGSGKPNPTVWSGKPGVRYNWRVRGY